MSAGPVFRAIWLVGLINFPARQYLVASDFFFGETTRLNARARPLSIILSRKVDCDVGFFISLDRDTSSQAAGGPSICGCSVLLEDVC